MRSTWPESADKSVHQGSCKSKLQIGQRSSLLHPWAAIGSRQHQSDRSASRDKSFWKITVNGHWSGKLWGIPYEDNQLLPTLTSGPKPASYAIPGLIWLLETKKTIEVLWIFFPLSRGGMENNKKLFVVNIRNLILVRGFNPSHNMFGKVLGKEQQEKKKTDLVLVFKIELWEKRSPNWLENKHQSPVTSSAQATPSSATEANHRISRWWWRWRRCSLGFGKNGGLVEVYISDALLRNKSFASSSNTNIACWLVVNRLKTIVVGVVNHLSCRNWNDQTFQTTKGVWLEEPSARPTKEVMKVCRYCNGVRSPRSRQFKVHISDDSHVPHENERFLGEKSLSGPSPSTVTSSQEYTATSQAFKHKK